MSSHRPVVAKLGAGCIVSRIHQQPENLVGIGWISYLALYSALLIAPPTARYVPLCIENKDRLYVDNISKPFFNCEAEWCREPP